MLLRYLGKNEYTKTEKSQEFAFFDSAKRKWIMSRDGNVIIKSLQQIFTDNQANQTHLH